MLLFFAIRSECIGHTRSIRRDIKLLGNCEIDDHLCRELSHISSFLYSFDCQRHVRSGIAAPANQHSRPGKWTRLVSYHVQPVTRIEFFAVDRRWNKPALECQ